MGQIITHLFILCGTFLVQLARLCFEEILTRTAENNHESLIHSFLTLLPHGEQDNLANAMNGHHFDQNDVVDVLSEFDVHTLRMPFNLTPIIIRVAKSELIHKLYIVLNKVRETMPQFWNTIL